MALDPKIAAALAAADAVVQAFRPALVKMAIEEAQELILNLGSDKKSQAAAIRKAIRVMNHDERGAFALSEPTLLIAALQKLASNKALVKAFLLAVAQAVLGVTFPALAGMAGL